MPQGQDDHDHLRQPSGLAPWDNYYLHRHLMELKNMVASLRMQVAKQTQQTTNIGVRLMATLAEIQDAVANETSVEQSAITLLQQLASELQAALNNNDPAAMQSILDQVNANATGLAAAVTANTPTPPAPPTP